MAAAPRNTANRMKAVLDFLSMGGYAAYVWSALGLTAVVLIGLWIVTLRTVRVRERQLRLLGRREADRVRSRNEA